MSATLTVDGNPDSPLESVELLDGEKQDYHRMLEAIAGAQRNVHQEVDAFAPVGVSFAEALAHAATRGVVVQVTVDGLGSARVPPAPRSRPQATRVRLDHPSELSR